MKAPHNPPNLALELLRIHRVITRGLNVGTTKGTEFQLRGFPNPRLRRGYTDYTQSLAVALRVHHLAEDEIGFPFLKEKFPHAPFERLSRDHQEMETLLEPLMKATTAVAGEGNKGDMNLLVDTLRSVSAIWTPHIRLEEDSFTEDAVAATVDSADQVRLSVEFGKHSQAHAKPPSLMLPFILFNLNAEDRAVMAAPLPSVVRKVLIPFVWKNKWGAMKPFLLDEWL